MDELETIEIKSGNTSVVIIPQKGGIVAKFTVDGKDILYLDELTLSDPNGKVRGGIPILFPNAGPFDQTGKYKLPQHGFARVLPWSIAETNPDSVSLELVSSHETFAVYPYLFKLTETIKVEDSKLIFKMNIENTGVEDMPISFGTHPYFYFPKDILPNFKTSLDSEFDNSSLEWDKGFDLVFENSGDFWFELPDRRVEIESASKFEKLVVWTLPEKDFVCFEPWTKEAGSLDNPEKCVWVDKGQNINYEFSINVEYTN